MSARPRCAYSVVCRLNVVHLGYRKITANIIGDLSSGDLHVSHIVYTQHRSDPCIFATLRRICRDRDSETPLTESIVQQSSGRGELRKLPCGFILPNKRIFFSTTPLCSDQARFDVREVICGKLHFRQGHPANVP